MRTTMAICLSALLYSCGSDPASPGSGTPPPLPAIASFQMPQIANASSSTTPGGAKFRAALSEASYWMDTVATQISTVGSLYATAQSATPVAKAGSWEWTLTSGANTGTLTATRARDTVAWTFTVLGPSAISSVTGSSSIEGDSGVWILHEPGQVPLFRISYDYENAAPDTVTFALVKTGDARKDSYLRYTVPDADQRQVVVRHSEIPSLATIMWSQASGAGSYITNVLPGTTLCWGFQSAGYPDATCP